MKFKTLVILFVLISVVSCSVATEEKKGFFGQLKNSLSDFFSAMDAWKPTKEKETVKGSMEEYINELKKETTKLEELAQENLKHATQAIRSQFGEFKGRFQETSSAQKEKLEGAYDKTKAKLGEAYEKTKDALDNDKLEQAYDKTKAKLGEAFEKTKEMLDKEKLGEAYEKTKAKLEEAYEKTKETLDKENLKEIYEKAKDSMDKQNLNEVYEKTKSKMGEAYEKGKGAVNEAVDRAKKSDLADQTSKFLDEHHLSDKLHRAWESVRDTVEIESMNLESKTRQQTRSLKQKLNDFMDQITITDTVYEKAAALRDQVTKLENRIAGRARALANMFGIRFGNDKVRHHIHHPFITCGNCQRLYSLREFLDYYDPQQTLNLVEENFWTDSEVEEFWSGWVEYANRMKLHCIQCGAANWVGVEFAIDDDFNHTLLEDPLHGKGDAFKAPHKHVEL